MIALEKIVSRTGWARLHSARASLIATALLLLAIAIVAPHLVWVCLVGFALVLLATFITSRSGNLKRLRQMVERRQQRTWPRNAMKSVVEAFDVPAYILDRAGVIRYANQASNEAFDATQIGEPLSFKFRAPEISRLVESATSQNERVGIEVEESASSKRWFAAECIPVPKIRNSGILNEPSKFFLLTFTDMTQIRITEQTRSDFIANASHELRTPLASLRASIETLQGPARDDKKARGEFLNTMSIQAERMSRLIDDLLSLSNIEMKAHMQPDEEIDLAAVLAQVKTDILPLSKKYSVDLKFTGLKSPALIIADKNEIIQVFHNLLENACKYGRKGGKVELALTRKTASDKSPGAIRVSIKDQGEGIHENHIPRLTERFFRAPNSDPKKPKGTGLGLAIVKHILARHNGELNIDSVVGKGTTVTILFENTDK